MHALKTEIDITAHPDTVWGILTDFAAYPKWNPFICAISGGLTPGSRLSIQLRPPGGKTITVRPTLLAAEPGREFRWRGRFLIPGLFTGEHFFRLERMHQGNTRLVHGELFSGLLVKPMQSFLNGATREGFIAMNEALKQRAEDQTGSR